MNKWVLRIVLGLVVLLVAAVAIAWAMVDQLAKKGIEQGGTYATGVPTQVQEVNLSLLGGSLGLNNLTIGNPQGFTSPHVVKSGRFSLEVRPGSLLNQTIEVPSLVLDGLDLNIEQTLKGNNISTVLAHIKGLSDLGAPKSDSDPAAPKSDSDKRVRLGSVTIRNVVAHVYLAGVARSEELTIKVPEIQLKDVSTDQPNGVLVSQLFGQLLPAIVAAVVENGKDTMPMDLQSLLNDDLLATANSAGPAALAMLKQTAGKLVDKRLNGVLSDPAKAVPDQAQQNIQGALKGLKLPGNKAGK